MKTLIQIKKELNDLINEIESLIGTQTEIPVRIVNINKPKTRRRHRKVLFTGKLLRYNSEDIALKKRALELLENQLETQSAYQLGKIIGFQSPSTVKEIIKRQTLNRGSAERIVKLFG